MRVFLLLKHPPHPYYAREHLKVAEVVGVYGNISQPKAIADLKNSKKPKYLWTVCQKELK